VLRKKVFTLLCKFIYRHPLIYAIADKICFPNAPKWREITAKFITPGERVLELGSGRYPAIKTGTAIDTSWPLLGSAPASLWKVCASANRLPFQAETFDRIVTIFPPGIGADEGFFQKKEFWEELHRVLSPNGCFVALIYIQYKNFLLRLLSKILDPLLESFWKNLGELTKNFYQISDYIKDSKGNGLVFVIAQKKS